MEGFHGCVKILMSFVIHATFLKRKGKFVASVELDGKILDVHMNNTGILRNLLVEGKRVIIYPIDGRKLRYRLAGVHVERGKFAVLDTLLQEEAVRKALEDGRIGFLRGFRIVGRHVKLGRRRIDFLLYDGRRYIYMELKSAVSYHEDGSARYPDTRTRRGEEHIELLSELGRNAVLLFVVAHPKARFFKPYTEEIANLLRKASSGGVRIHALKMYMDTHGRIVLSEEPVEVVY